MRSKGVRLNFYHWYKTPSTGFSKKNSATTPLLHGFGRASSDLQLCFVQLKTLAPSARYSTCKYTVTLKPGSLEVIGTDTYRSATYDFLLTFRSNYRPISHRFSDKRRFPSKIAIFSNPRVFNAPAERVLFGIGYRRRGQKKLE